MIDFTQAQANETLDTNADFASLRRHRSALRSTFMRATLLFILLTATSLLAISTRPSVERGAAVFTGRIISTEKVKVDGSKSGKSKWEIWRAEVKLHSVIKQDTNLAASVFVYYSQDHVDDDGTHYMQVCPAQPRLTVGETNKFFCIRANKGDAKNTLFIPEGGWVTGP